MSELRFLLAERILAEGKGDWRAPFGRNLFILRGAEGWAGIAAFDETGQPPQLIVFDVKPRQRPARLLEVTPEIDVALAKAHAHAEPDASFSRVQFAMGLDAPAPIKAWKKLLDGFADLDGAGLRRADLARQLALMAKEIERAEDDNTAPRRGEARLPTAIALDVGTVPGDETSPGRIFELGMVALKDGRRDGGSADQIRFRLRASDLKRLKKADGDLLASEKSFADFAPALRRKIGNAPILGWNVDGDLKSLNREFEAAAVHPVPPGQAVDLLAIARRIVPDLPKGGYELGRFASRFDLAPGFKLHLSLQDADLVARLAEHAAFRPHIAARIRSIAGHQFSLAGEPETRPGLAAALKTEMELAERGMPVPPPIAQATRDAAKVLRDSDPSPALAELASFGLQRVIEDVHVIARRMNPTVTVEVAARLVGTDGKNLLASGAPPDQVLAMSGNLSGLKKRLGLSTEAAQAMIAQYREGLPVAGIYRRLENLAQISLDIAAGRDPIESAHHELWHSLEQLLTPKERRTLLMDVAPSPRLAAARQDALASGDKKRIEAIENETLAYGFAEWAAGRFRGAAQSEAIWNRLRQFLVSLGHYLRGEGFDDKYAIFRRAYEGGIGRRAVARAKKGLHPTAEDISLGVGGTGRATIEGGFRLRALGRIDGADPAEDPAPQFAVLDRPLRLDAAADRDRLRDQLESLTPDHMRRLHDATARGLSRLAALAPPPAARAATGLLAREIGAALALIESVAAGRGLSLDRARPAPMRLKTERGHDEI